MIDRLDCSRPSFSAPFRASPNSFRYPAPRISILLPWFLGWPDPGLSFDVALHLGTLVALLIYFRNDWIALTLRHLDLVRGEPRSERTDGHVHRCCDDSRRRSPACFSKTSSKTRFAIRGHWRHADLCSGAGARCRRTDGPPQKGSRSTSRWTRCDRGRLRAGVRARSRRIAIRSHHHGRPVSRHDSAKPPRDSPSIFPRRSLAARSPRRCSISSRPALAARPDAAVRYRHRVGGHRRLSIDRVSAALSSNTQHVLVCLLQNCTSVLWCCSLSGSGIRSLESSADGRTNLVVPIVVPTEHRRLMNLSGWSCATAAILLGLSLISFNPDDPSFNISKNPRFRRQSTRTLSASSARTSRTCFFQVLGLLGFPDSDLSRCLRVLLARIVAGKAVSGSRLAGMILMMLTIVGVASACPSLPRFAITFPPAACSARLLADNLERHRESRRIRRHSAVAAFLVSLFLVDDVFLRLGSRVPEAAIPLRLRRWPNAGQNGRRASAASAIARRPREERKDCQRSRSIVTEKHRNARALLQTDAACFGEVAREPVAQAANSLPRATRRSTSKTQTAASPEFPPTAPCFTAPAAADQVDEERTPRTRARLIEEKAREFEVEGVGSADSSRPRRHDVRIQARSRA